MNCNQVGGIDGTRGKVDDRSRYTIVLEVLLDTLGIARVGICRAETAVDSAGTCGDDGSSVLAGVEQVALVRSAGGGTRDAQNLAIVAGHDSTLDDDDVLALSSLDRLLASFLEGVASSGREGLGVVEREILEEQRCRIGVIRLGKRLGATGAGTKLHPDDWCEAALAQTSVRTDKGVALDGFGNIAAVTPSMPIAAAIVPQKPRKARRVKPRDSSDSINESCIDTSIFQSNSPRVPLTRNRSEAMTPNLL